MTNIEIQDSIIRSISQLSLPQQMKLLDFIKSLIVKKQEGRPEGLLKFAGAFAKEDLKEMENALEDCEKIDEDESSFKLERKKKLDYLTKEAQKLNLGYE